MALNLDPQSIAEALRRNVESWSPTVEREEVGRVMEAGDGIARVKGLPRAMANELLEFPGDVLGVAFNLDEDEIGCIILGESEHIEEGDLVKQTGRSSRSRSGTGSSAGSSTRSAIRSTARGRSRRTRGATWRCRPRTWSTASP